MRRACLALLLSAAPLVVFAQQPVDPNLAPPPPGPPPTDVPPPPQPPAPEAAPAPESYPPAPPPAASAPPAAAPGGQWVYTNQYGWLWMPYGQQYTFVPGDAQVFPDQYVYYPVYGWRWVAAPWVYGYGPAPYWGAPGPRYFVWYSHPWFRVGGYWGWGGYRSWGQYRGWVGPRTWGARGWAGAPAYYRTGVGGPHPARVVRAEPARRPAAHERARGERRQHER